MTHKTYPKRWFFIMSAMALTFLTGFLWGFNGFVFVMFWWWCLVPLWSVLALGSVRSRVVNGLPLFVFWLYGLMSLLSQDPTHYLFLFYFTPYVSLMVKPQRHPIKYLTLIFSTGSLFYGLFTQTPIALPIRVLVVIGINVVFFPPYLWFKLKSILQKNPRSSE